MKTILIIPGFSEKPNDAPYQKIAKMFKAQGFEPIVLDIEWKRRVMSDYISDALASVKDQEIYLTLGFSFGAFISLATASVIKPEKLILCSLSPSFSECLPHIRPWWKVYMGKHRVADLENYSLRKICAQVTSSTSLLVGGAESPEARDVAESAHRLIKTSQLQIVSNSHHNIGTVEYQSAIEEVLNNLI